MAQPSGLFSRAPLVDERAVTNGTGKPIIGASFWPPQSRALPLQKLVLCLGVIDGTIAA